jgi:hypothetical protein
LAHFAGRNFRGRGRSRARGCFTPSRGDASSRFAGDRRTSS